MLRSDPPPVPLTLAQMVERGLITPAQAVTRLQQRRRTAARAGSPAVDPAAQAAQPVEAVLAARDPRVGRAAGKRTGREIQAYTVVQQRRLRAGLVAEPVAMHMVFTGNPGTGKTTVARLLGRLFKELGVLAVGHMVEVERADLVGEYIGHTAQRTRERLREAVGGVLFVDEAYSLARGGEKDFGKECIDCLVRGMEEQRSQTLLILAGYPEEMACFLAANPGLRSRLPLQIHFPDYTGNELVQIAEGMLTAREYALEPAAREVLVRHLGGWGWRLAAPEGNARSVRNAVERAMRRQAVRLLGRPEATRQELMTISASDLAAALVET